MDCDSMLSFGDGLTDLIYFSTFVDADMAGSLASEDLYFEMIDSPEYGGPITPTEAQELADYLRGEGF